MDNVYYVVRELPHKLAANQHKLQTTKHFFYLDSMRQ